MSEVKTSNKYLALCVFWAIIGERLHFGIRQFGFRRGVRAIRLPILRKSKPSSAADPYLL